MTRVHVNSAPLWATSGRPSRRSSDFARRLSRVYRHRPNDRSFRQPRARMFKKFKDKLAEEMKQSPARLQASVQQLAQVALFLSSLMRVRTRFCESDNLQSIPSFVVVSCRRWCRRPCPTAPFRMCRRQMTISVWQRMEMVSIFDRLGEFRHRVSRIWRYTGYTG